jgi:hypothetical protein
VAGKTEDYSPGKEGIRRSGGDERGKIVAILYLTRINKYRFGDNSTIGLGLVVICAEIHGEVDEMTAVLKTVLRRRVGDTSVSRYASSFQYLYPPGIY